MTATTTALRFEQHDVSGLLSIAHLVPRSKGRTGLYVLAFANGERYVGQSLDVVGRFSDHRRRWADIVRLEFSRVKVKDLDRLEQEVIHAQQRDGAVLRNVTFARGNPTVGTDLDLTVEPSEQFAWLNGDEWLEDVDARVTSRAQRLSKRESYRALTRRPDFRVVELLLNLYVQLTIPRPRATELTFWALSAMPSTNRATWPRLAALSINKMETAVLCTPKDDPMWILPFINVSASTLREYAGSLTSFEKSHPGVGVREAGYEAAGGDCLTLTFDDPRVMLGSLLADGSPLVPAARDLNLRLMRKGPTFQWRGHCFDLADHVVDPLPDPDES